ncbi:hypothetical protein BH23CHL6_BH23CHL6_10610 [soil metagenome]
MTLDRLGRWRLPAVAAISILVAAAVAVGILVLGDALDSAPPPPPSNSPSSTASPLPSDSPESAVREFFEAFAKARETDDPDLIEPHVAGTDSSAYRTAAGFLLGQREVGRASVTTTSDLTDFEVSTDRDRATVLFTLVEGGYDIDLDTGEPLESPMILEPRRVRAELVRSSDRWLLESYEATDQ